MAPQIYRSPFPDVKLSKADLLTSLFSNPHKTPLETPIFIDPESNQKRTLEDVISRTRRFSGGLRSLGVKQQDVVAIWSPNTIDYATLCFGVIGAGAIASPMSAALTLDEFKAQMQTSGARHVIVHSTLMKIALKASTNLPMLWIMQSDCTTALNEVPTAEYLMSSSPEVDLVKLTPSDVESRIAFLCFSSGTSGEAKGVMTTHNNITSNIEQWAAQMSGTIGPGGTWIAFLPFSHIYALHLFLCQGVRRGTTTIVVTKFDWHRFLALVQTHRPLDLWLVPPVVLRLAKDPVVAKYDLSSVQRIMSAAAPLSLELAQAIETAFSTNFGTETFAYQVWGMTETSPVATSSPPDRPAVKAGVGYITPNMEFRFVDPETSEDAKVAANGTTEPAEIWCWGPNVTPGYWKNDKATRESFHVDDNGRRWFKTGDIGTIDRNGWVEIRDRIKEIIKYKGFQVIPSELEGKIQEHPDIADCCVVGSWDETQATELPAAFVVLRPGLDDAKKTNAAEDVSRWLNERVSAHNRMRGGIHVVDNIAKSPTGKILRRLMRGRLKERTLSRL